MVDKSCLGLVYGVTQLAAVLKDAGEVDVLHVVPHVSPVQPGFAADGAAVLVT